MLQYLPSFLSYSLSRVSFFLWRVMLACNPGSLPPIGLLPSKLDSIDASWLDKTLTRLRRQDTQRTKPGSRST